MRPPARHRRTGLKTGTGPSHEDCKPTISLPSSLYIERRLRHSASPGRRRTGSTKSQYGTDEMIGSTVRWHNSKPAAQASSPAYPAPVPDQQIVPPTPEAHAMDDQIVDFGAALHCSCSDMDCVHWHML